MGKTRALRKYRRKSKQVKTHSKSFSKKSRKRSSKQKKNKRTVKRRLGVKNRRTRRIMRGGGLKNDIPSSEEAYKNLFKFMDKPVAGMLTKTRYKLRNSGSSFGQSLIHGVMGKGFNSDEWDVTMGGRDENRYYIIENDDKDNPVLKYFAKPKGVIPLKNAILEFKDKESKGETHVYLQYVEDGTNEGRPAGTRGRVKLVFDTGNGLEWLKTYIEEPETAKISSVIEQIQIQTQITHLEAERDEITSNIDRIVANQRSPEMMKRFPDPPPKWEGTPPRIKKINEQISRLRTKLDQLEAL